MNERNVVSVMLHSILNDSNPMLTMIVFQQEYIVGIQQFKLTLSDRSLNTSSQRPPPHSFDILTFFDPNGSPSYPLDGRGIADFDELIHKKYTQYLEVLSYSFIL